MVRWLGQCQPTLCRAGLTRAILQGGQTLRKSPFVACCTTDTAVNGRRIAGPLQNGRASPALGWTADDRAPCGKCQSPPQTPAKRHRHAFRGGLAPTRFPRRASQGVLRAQGRPAPRAQAGRDWLPDEARSADTPHAASQQPACQSQSARNADAIGSNRNRISANLGKRLLTNASGATPRTQAAAPPLPNGELQGARRNARSTAIDCQLRAPQGTNLCNVHNSLHPLEAATPPRTGTRISALGHADFGQDQHLVADPRIGCRADAGIRQRPWRDDVADVCRSCRFRAKVVVEGICAGSSALD